MYRSSAKYEAQDQLSGKTHYVDDDTLRFHHCRIISCDISHDGMLFWLIESVSLDMNNTKRGFRYVVFDVFGNVISRHDLADCVSTSKKARSELKEFLSGVNAFKITQEGIKQAKKQNERAYDFLNEQLKGLK
jgi:hypothetical protein